jgi:acetyl/propionyl-CoA carboxylase alpha subunit
VNCFRLPEGPGVRNDVGIEAGSSIPIDYDPMLGKLVARGRDRAEAIERLSRALDEYEIAGIDTTLPFFRELVRDPEFCAGRFHTQWLEDWLIRRKLEPSEASVEEAILAAVCVAMDGDVAVRVPADRGSRWKETARAEALRSPASPLGGSRR